MKLNLKHNKAEKEYKNELLIAENTYKHKLDVDLKDSAALTKRNDIEERKLRIKVHLSKKLYLI